MFDCIVVGAGPGGLTATKELIENGITNVLCLEQAQGLGGVFAKSYDNLKLTSSATFSMFSDYLNNDREGHHFWTKEEAVEYWKGYARHYGVDRALKFNTQVVKTEQLEDKSWDVYLSEDKKIQCKHLVIATGNNSKEKYPDWAEQLTSIEYTHSKYYQNNEQYKGKRVLVVGGGESASDMALEISQVADKCWVSLRESSGWVVPRKRGEFATDISTHRALWGLPRHFGEHFTKKQIRNELSKNDPVYDALVMLNKKIVNKKGIWGTYGTKTIALPKAIAHHGCQVVGEIIQVKEAGKQLVTDEGFLLDNVDVVVFSTGYHNHIPFLPQAYQSCDPRSLYKHMFNPELGTSLVRIGWARPGFGSQFPIMEMQARYLALLCKGAMSLPTPMDMEQAIQHDLAANIAQFEKNAERIRSLVDYFRYMDDLANIIGCMPPLVKYFFRHPKIWLHLLYGPSQATQYRLVGPGCKKELAHKILLSLPVSRFNAVVRIGLHMRFLHLYDQLSQSLRAKLS